MQRNLDTKILRLDGTEYDEKPTLKTVAFMAVTTPLQDDNHMPMAKKLELYGLAQKIHGGGVVDFTAEELATIKERVGKVFPSVLVVGQTVELLERDVRFASQAEFDAAADARDMPSGATVAPDQFRGD